MNLKEQYMNSFLLERTGLTEPNPFHPVFYNVSKTAIKTFFYLQGMNCSTVSYPFCYEMKGLNSFYLLYSVSGRGQLRYQDRIYPLPDESMVLIDCREYYRIEATHIPKWTFYGFFINGNTISEYYKMYTSDNFSVCPLSKLSSVPKIINKLYALNKQNTEYRELINSRIITDLLTSIIIEKDCYRRQEKTPGYILYVKNMFDNHYSRKHSLDSLSRELGISKYKLAREFTQYVSVSPIHYLIQVRLTNAKEMLLKTNKTVVEISESVGFENVSHFIRLFKKNTGLTPIAYRKQCPEALSYNV